MKIWKFGNLGTVPNATNLRLNNNKTKLAVGNWQLAKDRA